MYLPPNPLKGNREKFDNVQISRKSKVESSRVSNYSEPETRNSEPETDSFLKSSNPQILKSSNESLQPETRNLLISV